MSEIVLQAEALHRVYRRGSEDVYAVNNVNLTIRRGEFVALTGQSGSGKTTLVNILGCLDNPTSGALTLAGETIFTSGKVLSEHELTLRRRNVFGYIFQNFYLVPSLTVQENIELPLAFFRKGAGVPDIAGMMERLGIAHRAKHLPNEISGGEMQRVAIARALINAPEILLADEPTGNLDSQRSHEIGDILKTLNHRENLTILMVTHNPELAAIAGRRLEMRDGRLLDPQQP